MGFFKGLFLKEALKEALGLGLRFAGWRMSLISQAAKYHETRDRGAEGLLYTWASQGLRGLGAKFLSSPFIIRVPFVLLFCFNKETPK